MSCSFFENALLYFISVETVYTFTEITCDLSAGKRDTFN